MEGKKGIINRLRESPGNYFSFSAVRARSAISLDSSKSMTFYSKLIFTIHRISFFM